MNPFHPVGASLADARPTRRTDALHYGRVSLPAVRYFATFVTHERKPWLLPAVADIACPALDALRAWHAEGDGAVLAATIMPDHVHVLFQLGTRLTVGQCVGRWKSAARKIAGYEGGWQRDFWEHRLRPDESAEDYALYIFLNPYRAGLLPIARAWPWWWTPDGSIYTFARLLGPEGTPPAEWIGWPEERFRHLSVHE